MADTSGDGTTTPAVPDPQPSAAVVDPDRQCAVQVHRMAGQSADIVKRCAVRLTCRIHSTAQKEAVTDRSRPFQELLRLEPGSITFQSYRRKYTRVFDPNVHCGVPSDDGQPCTSTLTCRSHELGAKRAVQGRSGQFDELLNLYQRNNMRYTDTVDPDVQCAVALPGGGRCSRNLQCSVHTAAERSAVERSVILQTLTEIQLAQEDVRMVAGYGLAVAAYGSDLPIRSLRWRYRRGGVQLESLHNSEGCDTPDEWEFDGTPPLGPNLERIQQILYQPVTEMPEQDILKILPQNTYRDIDNRDAKIFTQDGGPHFAFFPKTPKLVRTLPVLQRAISNAMELDATLISWPKHFPPIDGEMADGILRQLDVMLRRLPFKLFELSDALKSILLSNAILLHNRFAARYDKPTIQIPFKIERALVDNKPCLLMPITHFVADSWDTFETVLALPVLSEPNDVVLPQIPSFYQITGLDFGSNWFEFDLSEERKRRLYDIVVYIVSSVSLSRCSRAELRYVAAFISERIEVPLLIGPDRYTAKSTIEDRTQLAVYDSTSGVISPTAQAREIAPWLTNIEVSSIATSAPILFETLVNRFMHTKDLWLSWADTANAADMHATFGPSDPSLLRSTCMHSLEEAKTELHPCNGCSRSMACCNFKRVIINEQEARLCPTCLPPEEPLLPGTSTTAAMREPNNDATNPQDLSTLGTATARGQHSHGQAPSSHGQAPVSHVRSPQRERGRVRGTINTLINTEHRLVFPERANEAERKVEIATANNHLLSAFHESSGDQGWAWTDDYFDSPCVKTDSLLCCSVDAAYPLVRHNQRPRIHVSSNLRLTRFYANSMMLSNSPIALQLLHLLDAATTQEEEDRLVERIDYLHIIRSQIPFETPDRLAVSTFDEPFAKEFKQEWDTGIPTASACRRIALLGTDKNPYLWRFTKAKARVSEENITIVRMFALDLESIAKRPLRRIDGVPFPFKGGPEPEWSWPILFGFFGQRWRVLKRSCNSRFITNFDVPEFICAVLYILVMGRDAKSSILLDVPVCLYTRHLLSISVGKDDHAKGMTTGFIAGQAISLQNFQIENCNLCVEPWGSNVAKKTRDEEVDDIRTDFREHLKLDNPPLWTQQLWPIDEALSRQYIHGTGIGYADDQNQSNSGGSPGTPEYRNLSNLGQTCYLSSVLQVLLNNTDIRKIVADSGNFPYQLNTARVDAEFLPHSERISSLSANQILNFRQQRLSSQHLLVKHLTALGEKLDLGGGDQLPAEDTRVSLNSIRAIDDRWTNRSDESAHLLYLIVDNLTSASDVSTPDARGGQQRMAIDQAYENAAGTLIFPVVVDASAYWRAFRAEGHDSPLTDLLYTQFVQETPCGDQNLGCNTVSRSFEATSMLYIDFPRNANASAQYQLEGLLDSWAQDTVDPAAGHRCEHDLRHTLGTVTYRRITQAAKYICFALRRGYSGNMLLQNHVDFQESLDLAQYMDIQTLPSEVGQRSIQQNQQKQETRYVLEAVVNWIGGHFIAYVYKPTREEDQVDWVMFNDLLPKPLRVSPSQGWDKGEIVHFGIYKRHDDKPEIPPVGTSSLTGFPSPSHAPSAGNSPSSTGNSLFGPGDDIGHDDDDDVFGGSTGDKDDNSPESTTPRGTSRGLTLFSPTGGDFTHDRTPRQRPESADSNQPSGRNVTPRGAFHADVASARNDQQLSAREAKIKEQEEALAKRIESMDKQERERAAKADKADKAIAQLMARMDSIEGEVKAAREEAEEVRRLFR